jgi:hypothetical protein
MLTRVGELEWMWRTQVGDDTVRSVDNGCLGLKHWKSDDRVYASEFIDCCLWRGICAAAMFATELSETLRTQKTKKNYLLPTTYNRYSPTLCQT